MVYCVGFTNANPEIVWISNQRLRIWTITDNYQPLLTNTSTNHHKPLLTSINKYSPLLTMINPNIRYKPLLTMINHDQP